MYRVTSPEPIENPHERDFLEVELFQQLIQIRGEGVVVVPDTRLARSAEAAAVVRDDSVPGCEERRRLLFPRRSAQWPPVNQNDRRAGPMVLVIKLDGCGVLF